MENFEKIKNFLDSLTDENIKFKLHFFDKIKERPISKELVVNCLKKTERLLKVEEQKSTIEGQEKYKLWIKLSNKYNLVVIVGIVKKDLYIITAWNTDRKWQNSIQK